ncbi:DnaD domain protein [Macrococcus hajekii]|uniref:DnaD domain protein n=1 Tax=Macrococcus hajekii TaxID=198482 RepID=A0A4R6BME7_9STAP|nr:DnaD domain protein [Macrococcus hajekii]TDM03004.1 DnaD domain protein [Macrococcus hajekii]GGB05727.1 chromosome replication protein DnaD [Macrococcus hajekii]
MQLINQHLSIPKRLITDYPLLNINETELVTLIKLIDYHHQEMPSFEALASGMTLTHEQVAAQIQGLIQKGLIAIHVDQSNHQYSERLSLEPLDDRLQTLKEVQPVDKEMNFNALFERFEVAFSRPLTPIEMQTLSHWLDSDRHSVEIIQAALDEAVSHDKLSFKYIDRILLNWQKRHVKTIDDSKTVSNDFKTTKKMTKTIENFPVFDWVNGDNPYVK